MSLFKLHRFGLKNTNCGCSWSQLVLRASLVMVFPVFVLAERTTVACQTAPWAGFVCLPATVPAWLQNDFTKNIPGNIFGDGVGQECLLTFCGGCVDCDDVGGDKLLSAVSLFWFWSSDCFRASVIYDCQMK